MSLLEFLVDFASSGRVEGAGIYSSPGDWGDSLGGDYIDDRQKKQFRRDYGLVELGFWRVEQDWRCGSVSLQVHRLWWHSDTTGPARLRRKYGPFPKDVRLEDLRESLGTAGNELQLIEDKAPGRHARYYVPDTKVLITALTSDDTDQGGMPGGAVWALSLSDNADAWIRPR
jgi:hypothetical protein